MRCVILLVSLKVELIIVTDCYGIGSVNIISNRRLITQYYSIGCDDKQCRHKQVVTEPDNVWRGSISKHQHVALPALISHCAGC